MSALRRLKEHRLSPANPIVWGFKNTSTHCGINKIPIASLVVLVSLSFIQCDKIAVKTDYFSGTQLTGTVGINFELLDQKGRLVSNFGHGKKAAILTFLFTNCTDVCPIVTTQIKSALSGSEELSDIPVIIITVDPDRDNQQTRLDFVNKWNLTPNWRFLSGDFKSLSNIWNSYHVNPQSPSVNAQRKLHNSLLTKYKVIHTTPVYILDEIGRPRLLHTTPINSENLRADLIIMISK